MAEKYGLLIDYTWCTGCHSCEMACKVEHGWQAGEANGIQLFEDGPRLMPNGKYEYNYLPCLLYTSSSSSPFSEALLLPTSKTRYRPALTS